MGISGGGRKNTILQHEGDYLCLAQYYSLLVVDLYSIAPSTFCAPCPAHLMKVRSDLLDYLAIDSNRLSRLSSPGKAG